MIDYTRKPKWTVPCAVGALLVVALYTLSSLQSRDHAGFELRHNSVASSREVQDVQDRCHAVINDQKVRLYETFSDVLHGVRNIALISMPDHVNKGDSVIFVAEMELLASLGINVKYSCGVRDCSMQKLKDVIEDEGNDHFAIAFHGGGNLGDLYEVEYSLKLRVMREFSSVRMHVFPQSIKFRNGDKVLKETRAALAGLTHPLNSLAVRDVTSHAFALEHFSLPNLRIDLTPDMAFYIGFRPDLRKLLAPRTPQTTTDLLFFRRKDPEGSSWDWAGGAGHADFPQAFARQLSKATDQSLTSATGDWINFDLTDDERRGGHIQFRAWRRFMLGAEWLSSTDFVVMDRLHGHIVSLLLGVPHILIDNNIGKLGDYFATWTHDCPLGELVVDTGEGSETMSRKVQDAYARWYRSGQISGRDFL